MPRSNNHRWAIAALPILVLSLLSGCRSCFHTGSLPSESAPCNELPQACKNRVHVFFLHGLDPLDLANLRGAHDHVRSLGFIKSYYGHPVQASHFEEELRKAHECDPEARFALVGLGHGGAQARTLASDARSSGIAVDLVIVIDGNCLSIERDGSGPEDHVIAEGGHLDTATDPQALALLEQELAVVAARVPVVHVLAASGPGAPPVLPPPSPEWAFLRPDTHAHSIERSKPTPDAPRH